MAEDNAAVKQQLNQLITSKTAEINTCNSIRQELNKEKGNLEKYRNRWEKQYQKHVNSKIASRVVVKNVFEGVIADKLKDYYGAQVENMYKTSDKINKLCTELNDQIGKLNTYVSGLQRDITTTQNRINSMED